MTHPTKEAVDEAITRIEYYRDAWVEDFNVLNGAYLALMDEMTAQCIQNGQLSQMYGRQSEDMVEALKQRDARQAESQRLKEEVDELKRKNELLVQTIERSHEENAALKQISRLEGEASEHRMALMKELERLHDENRALTEQQKGTT